jgi:hypothetical protein
VLKEILPLKMLKKYKSFLALKRMVKEQKAQKKALWDNVIPQFDNVKIADSLTKSSIR